MGFARDRNCRMLVIALSLFAAAGACSDEPALSPGSASNSSSSSASSGSSGVRDSGDESSVLRDSGDDSSVLRDSGDQADAASIITAAPTPSPAPPGNVGASTDVTLASESPGAVIHYTTDGTPVTCTNGTIYAGSFAVAAKTTVNAIACRAGFEPSAAWSVVYGITTPAPIFVTGLDRAQLVGDPAQVDMPSGTVLGQNVRLRSAPIRWTV